MSKHNSNNLRTKRKRTFRRDCLKCYTDNVFSVPSQNDQDHLSCKKCHSVMLHRHKCHCSSTVYVYDATYSGCCFKCSGRCSCCTVCHKLIKFKGGLNITGSTCTVHTKPKGTVFTKTKICFLCKASHARNDVDWCGSCQRIMKALCNPKDYPKIFCKNFKLKITYKDWDGDDNIVWLSMLIIFNDHMDGIKNNKINKSHGLIRYYRELPVFSVKDCSHLVKINIKRVDTHFD